jgi:hypothetical protein
MPNDDSGDDGADGPHWSTKNRQVTYEQGNRVLEAQKDDINDIDDKALRTVRITALIIGVAATGLQAVKDLTVNDTTAAIGLGSLFISLTFGVLTYSESAEIVGPTADYLDRMRDGRKATDWEVDLLIQLPGWISRNQEKVERNALLFTCCQFTLLAGVGFGAAALIPIGPWKAALGILTAGVLVSLGWVLIAITTSRDHPN